MSKTKELHDYIVHFGSTGGDWFQEEVTTYTPKEAAETQNFMDGPGEWEVEVWVELDGEEVYSCTFTGVNEA